MIEQHKKFKIALIGYRLSSGGSDRVMARLSLFFEKQGIEVHNLIVIDQVTYPYAGKLVNLGLLKKYGNSLFNRVNRMRVLKRYLNENQFDYIIDFRFRIKPLQELILARCIYNTKTIFTVHSYLIDHYMPNWSWLTRLIYNHSYSIVAVSNQIKSRIQSKHQLKNVVTILNPIDIIEIDAKKEESIDLDYEYIIAVGQFENPLKQFDKLITNYALSDLPQKNIHLVILGDGNVANLESIITAAKASKWVHLLGYQDNPFKYLAKAKFLVLSSQNEGFPNVIMEALAVQTPVVSFDCPSGPKEMLNGKNGILVENQNWTELINAMNRMINDEAFYELCKQNSRESCNPFLIETIGKQWMDLMNIK
ncbi:glycosyltransferase [Flavobacterium sp. XGLA_31]|uniref:glycosyltransferase n=1 Tax=Flavobacterium sp. XGLA_31 TaxID=3447666 RepID=UPI003F3A0D19